MCRLSLGNDFHPMTGNLRRKFENNDETLKYVAILRGSPLAPSRTGTVFYASFRTFNCHIGVELVRLHFSLRTYTLVLFFVRGFPVVHVSLSPPYKSATFKLEGEPKRQKTFFFFLFRVECFSS